MLKINISTVLKKKNRKYNTLYYYCKQLFELIIKCKLFNSSTNENLEPGILFKAFVYNIITFLTLAYIYRSTDYN